jgi:hypothetical protein
MGLRREVRLALVLAFAAVTMVPSRARADAGLVVTRGEGATQCPDAEQLRRHALASAARSLPSPAHAYLVSFERAAGSYRAEIVDGTVGRTRRLEDTGPACGPLGQAVAVVLATMWGSEQSETSASPAAAPSASPSSAASASPANPDKTASDKAAADKAAADKATADNAAVSPSPPASPQTTEANPGEPERAVSPSTSRRPRWVFGAGGALAAAIVRPAAPALFGNAAIELAHASFAAGILWIPEQRIDVAPGWIEVRLVAGSVGACAFMGDATELGACAKILGGQLHAAAAGYSSGSAHGRPWLAIEPEIFADRVLVARVRARAAAGLTVPLHAETFSVTGAGGAYDTPAVGGLFSLSLEAEVP